MTYTVNVTDGQLDVGFEQLGNAVTINSIEVDEASGSSTVTIGGSGGSKSSAGSQSTNLFSPSGTASLGQSVGLVSPLTSKDSKDSLFNEPVEQQPLIPSESYSDEDVVLIDSVFEDAQVLRGL